MKTDVICVNSLGAQMDAALTQADKVAAYKELSHKGALHLRLLTEEMMGMMRSITGEKEGTFWIEDTPDGVFQLHLRVVTPMDSEKRDQLLSASTSGKNEYARGLMGRLRDFFSRGLSQDGSLPPSPLLAPAVFESSSSPTLDWEWTMTSYQAELSVLVRQKDPASCEMWDELEKSVVAHVADEVRVSIHGSDAEMIIYKKLV